MSSATAVEIRPYARSEFRCKGCGVIYRVDTEFSAGTIVGQGQKYHHCAADETRQLGGPIVAVWEKCGGDWVLKANRTTVR